MTEQRVTSILLEYWNRLRGSRPYPSESELSPDDLKEIWDHVFLLRVGGGETGGYNFRYEYMGESLIRAYGDNLTGIDVYDALLSTSRDTIVEDVLKTIKSRAPHQQDAEFDNVNQVRIKYRRLLCPLGTDDGRINYIVGVMRWKEE